MNTHNCDADLIRVIEMQKEDKIEILENFFRYAQHSRNPMCAILVDANDRCSCGLEHVERRYCDMLNRLINGPVRANKYI